MIHRNQQAEIESRDIFDFSEYIQVFKVNLKKAVLFTFVVSLCAAVYALSVTPKYSSTSTLLLESQNNKVISIEQIVGVDTSRQDYLVTQYEILKSNRIASQVIDELAIDYWYGATDTTVAKEVESLVKPVSFTMDLGESLNSAKDFVYRIPILQDILVKPRPQLAEQLLDANRQKVLQEFKSNLSISPVRNTQLVRISFISEDPILAAQVANKVGEVYIRSSLESRLEETRQASAWIGNQLSVLESNLKASELRLANFMQKEGLVDIDGVDSLATSELNSLINQISDVRDRRLAAESVVRSLKKSKQLDLAQVYSLPQVSNHPQIRDIRASEIEAEKQVLELSKRYGPKHDKMIQATAQLNAVQIQTRATVKQLMQGIEKELQTAINQEASLVKELEMRKQDFQTLSLKKNTYLSLKRDVDTNQQLYDLFLTRHKETNATNDFQASIAQFAERAELPLVPAKPRKAMIVGGSAAGSFIFAMMIAFIIHALKTTFERRSDIESKTGLFVFGSVPKILDKKYARKLIDSALYYDERLGIFGESIRNLRTSLGIKWLKSDNQCISVTSAVSGEGKTTIAMSIATSLSSMEKVLLIDCDMRTSSISPRFNLDESAPGLVDLLLGRAALDEVVVYDEHSGLHIIPAGKKSNHPQELIGSKQFRQLLLQLKEQYERIIIDTPAVNNVIDPVIVGALTDSCLLVVKADDTKVNQLKFAIKRLEQHGIVVSGAILNQDKSRTQDAYQFHRTYANA